jgi:hypothetical protein
MAPGSWSESELRQCPWARYALHYVLLDAGGTRRYNGGAATRAHGPAALRSSERLLGGVDGAPPRRPHGTVVQEVGLERWRSLQLGRAMQAFDQQRRAGGRLRGQSERFAGGANVGQLAEEPNQVGGRLRELHSRFLRAPAAQGVVDRHNAQQRIDPFSVQQQVPPRLVL